MNDQRFVQIAKALADPTRRRMVDELRAAGGGGLTCTCMVERFPLSQPTISHHVRTLEEAGLIRVERAGHYHVLSVNEAVLAEFARAVQPAAAEVATPVKPARPEPRAKAATKSASTKASSSKSASSKSASRASRSARPGAS